MPNNEKGWLDGLVGWQEAGTVVRTWWPEDPAIDVEASDLEEYGRTLSTEALRVLKGKKPTEIVITLPDAARWGNIQMHMSPETMNTSAIVAFGLCVRFPDIESAKPEYESGFRRLPAPFLAGLSRQYPQMLLNIGWWIINKYLLLEDEKKASSRESTQANSSKAPTTAQSAGLDEKESKDAPTTEEAPQEVETESSGSGAAGPSTSAGPSMSAPGGTSGEQMKAMHHSPR